MTPEIAILGLQCVLMHKSSTFSPGLFAPSDKNRNDKRINFGFGKPVGVGEAFSFHPFLSQHLKLEVLLKRYSLTRNILDYPLVKSVSKKRKREIDYGLVGLSFS